MISRFLDFIPDIEKFLEYNNSGKLLDFSYIRANSLKIDPLMLKKRLIEKGYTIKNTLLNDVFSIIKPDHFNICHKNKDSQSLYYNSHNNYTLTSIGATEEYLKGYYYIQDLSSCMAVNELDIQENKPYEVLDMAAAPGGKTTYLAQKMHNHGKIIACEPNIKRIKSLIFNLSRCSVKNTLVFNLPGEDIEKLGVEFDRILLDAPCSCEGIIGRDATRKKSRRLKDIAICSMKQKKLINSAIKTLKPNGIMVYCTCSFAPEENELIIDNVFKNNKNIELEPIRFGINGLLKFQGNNFIKEMINTKRLYPHIHNTNGFFIAKIRKR